VLKPLNTKRLDEALRRARSDLDEEAALSSRQQRLMDVLSHHETERPPTPDASTLSRTFVTRFAVKNRDRFVILKANDVDWIESAANYVQLHSNKGIHLLRTALGALESKLDPTMFVRVHRTLIVNVDRVREVIPSEHGDFTIRLEDGTELRMSRSFR